ncbi:MAG: zinc ABC transporter substrate-binding protein [Anaerolineae bacterium]|nr:zinc ABC transporter substrate-binding protein [Anaerolineae bacterium]
MMRSIRWVLIVTLVAVLSGSIGNTQAQSPLKIVTSTTILLDIAKNIAGDKAELASIVPTDGDPHEFEPTPDTVRLVADANLIFVNGVGLEGFLDKLISDSGTKASVITVSQGLAVRQFVEPGATADHQVEGLPAGVIGFSGMIDCTVQSGQSEGFCDPHLWQDPINVIQYVTNMRDALVAADVANADTYKLNAAKYIYALQSLDADTWSKIVTIPPEKRILVTNHDALGYFVARYRFQLVGTVLPGVSTSAEPSPQDVATLIEQIKQLGVPAIFTENIANDKLAQQIAQEAGIQVITALYTDALGAAGTPGETYLGMMRSNAEVIAKALGGQ